MSLTPHSKVQQRRSFSASGQCQNCRELRLQLSVGWQSNIIDRLPANLGEWTEEPDLPNRADEGMQDVDVLLFRPDRPIDYQLMRKELVSRFSGLFKERTEPLFFKYKRTDELKNRRKAKHSHVVQVDIIPDYLPPYLPAQAMALEEVDRGHLPFVHPLDLLAYKVHCSSMRSRLNKRKQDAEDAVRLWQTYYGEEYAPLSEGQRVAIASGVDLMAEYSWWCRWRKWRLRQWVNASERGILGVGSTFRDIV
ncbi:uncharacterized protein NFIA_095970 [Aspergillus fischeri NRRL 181]|uniref:Uncharacterized protein n=1 Tax=Neosartorya fischeri (strain ATCC 1020 / DSM 3700 / CBS 544.65 / FGSC A1164 / JCM 1740 / NRRL 181 / WB 181) TaxID=331117 RepID=A1DAT7_NEOFI|nr:uncharacterized protein NFIA_095970 [Aspergillus fischeri NRRL 181]EAW19977.1 hypothetical protein NFIA_095970 [Aspergillus fischeri NRRL 181]KAG2007740.1 hypothetical protein GB937_008392 [Aspergillus fischeri]